MLCSALSLLFMCTSKEKDPARIYTIACSYSQAQTVFDTALDMINASENLQNKGIKKKTIPYHQILMEGVLKKPEFRALASDGSDKDGLRPSVVFVDEGHQMKKFDVYNLLTNDSALIGRAEPLVISISTAGEQEGLIFNKNTNYALKVQKGEIEDDEFLAAYWGITQGEDWEDEKTFQMVNPSYGLDEKIFGFSITKEERVRMIKTAKGGDFEENHFRRKQLNEWIPASFDHWIKSDVWDEGKTTEDFESIFYEFPVYVGVDFAPNHDLTSIVMLKEVGDTVFLKHFTWATGIEIRKKTKIQGIPYEQWMMDGWLEMSAEKVLTDDMFLHYLKSKLLPYRNSIHSITYDKSRIENVMLQYQQEAPYHLFDIVQSPISLNEPTQAFYALVMNKKLVHQDDPLLRYCVANATIKKTDNDLIKVKKGNQYHQVDIVSASIFALDSLLREKHGAMEGVYPIPQLEATPFQVLDVLNKFQPKQKGRFSF